MLCFCGRTLSSNCVQKTDLWRSFITEDNNDFNTKSKASQLQKLIERHEQSRNANNTAVRGYSVSIGEQAVAIIIEYCFLQLSGEVVGGVVAIRTKYKSMLLALVVRIPPYCAQM